MAALKGTQFILPCKAFFCALCKCFCGDREAGEEHLFSSSHNRLHTKFLISKPEYDHIHNKDKATARAKAQATARVRKREVEEKRRQEEEKRKRGVEEKKRQEEEEKRKKEREARDRTVEESKYMKILNEKKIGIEKKIVIEKIEKTKKDDRGSSVKRKNVPSSRESSLETIKPDPLDDVKLKIPCSIPIPKEEYIRAKMAYAKWILAQSKTSGEGRLGRVTGSKDDSKDDSKSHSTPAKEDEGSAALESTLSEDILGDKNNLSFGDKNNLSFGDKKNLPFGDKNNLSSLSPPTLISPDNPVTPPDSAATGSDQVVGSSRNETSENPSTASSERTVASKFDAVFSALENDDDEDSSDGKSSDGGNLVVAEDSSPIKPGDPLKVSPEQVITGRDVQLNPVEDKDASCECSSSQELEDVSRDVSRDHSFPQLSLDDLTKSPSYG